MKTILAFTLLVALAAELAIRIPRTAEKASHQSDRFTALGDLPGGTFDSAARGVSADGSVVIGFSNSGAGIEAFRWTRRGGMVGLGFPQAFAVSADGSTVVGYRLIAHGSEPVRWTQDAALQGLGNIAGYEICEARGASADGSIIVGGCESRFDDTPMAFRWMPGRGIARLEPLPDGVAAAEAYAVSAEGDVVVGAIRYKSGRPAAFRWTSQNGFADLGVLPGDTQSMAHAVSADGTVVVGSSGTNTSMEAFRWTQKTGMVGLDTLPGGGHSCAFAASADGSIIVGQGGGASGPDAFVWDATHGMRSLRQLLMSEADLDASLRGWKLRLATAVSRDGSMIVGYGLNPSGNREAWIARLGDKPLTEASTIKIAAR